MLVPGPRDGPSWLAVVGMGTAEKLKGGGKSASMAFKALGKSLAGFAKQCRAESAAVWLPEDISSGELA